MKITFHLPAAKKRRRRKKRAKAGSRSRMARTAQTTVRIITADAYMNSMPFNRGFRDAKGGLPFDYAFVDANLHMADKYESGRLFALSIRAGAERSLRRGRRWNKLAVQVLTVCIRNGNIPDTKEQNA